MAKLFADGRCSEAILAFLGKTEVGLKGRCDDVEVYSPKRRIGWKTRSSYVVFVCFDARYQVEARRPGNSTIFLPHHN